MIRVDLDGLEEVQATLQRMKLKSSELSGAWDRIGAAIKRDALGLVPVLTGRLKNTIRQGKGKTKATVRAGNNRMPPYAGVIHYGGYNNIEPHPFLTTALSMNQGTAKSEVSDELQDLIRRLDLGTFR